MYDENAKQFLINY